MQKTTYLGRDLVAKHTLNRRSGAHRVEIWCNGIHAYSDLNQRDEAASLAMARAYVDQAEERPAAYPYRSP